METAKKKWTKGKKAGVIIGVVLVVLIAVALLYGFVLTRSGYWLLAHFRPDSEEQKQAFTSASDTTRTIASEGFVLMQNNDDLLPLSTSPESRQRINLFGARSVQPIFNAGGSAASDVSFCMRFEEALSEGNFEVNQELLFYYYNFIKSGKPSLKETTAPVNASDSEFLGTYSNHIIPELPASALLDTSMYSDGRSILDHAYEYSDLAMVVIGRSGGEMFDFTPAELQLQEEEAAMVDAVCSKFDKVILVINSANAMQLDFLNHYPQIKSVLWIGYPGEAGLASLAQIMNGTVNPSGRLADTWMRDIMMNVTTNNYLQLQNDGTWGIPGEDMYGPDNFHYTNADGGMGYFVQYSEGIYVGYKYFETRDDTDDSFDYDAAVQFPFGHGLSYTTFEKNIISLEEDNGVITVRVEVTNTGDSAGKDVLEIYYNPPYTGKIEKSTVNLITFKKTNEIAPGETELYSLEFDVEDMASYDYKVNKSYVLEAGDYEIMLCNNSHDMADYETWNLPKDIIYNDEHDGKRSSDRQTATNLFDYALGPDDYLTRGWDETSRAFSGPKAEDFIASQEILDVLAGVSVPTDADLGLTDADLPTYGVTLDKTLMITDMVGVPADDSKWDTFVSQLTLEEMANLSGNAGYHIEKIDRLGLPLTATPDGPSSIRTSIYSGAMMGLDAGGVTYPCPVVIASCWNQDIYRMMGTSIGTEAQAMGFGGWFAPAMDTHRTPFNGRNFEYYSEDGTLAGITASNVVRGATDKGVICFIKHFALNDRESNCRSQLMTWSNEQAIREIYLKPFEMAVKEGGALGAMSSFNFIGSKWCGANEELLVDVLRNEWGFEGAVITDAAMSSYMSPVVTSYSGGNLSLDMLGAMGMSATSHADMLLSAAKDPNTRIGVTRNLYESCKDILYALAQSWPVKNMS